jgi:hypothetical protein
MGIQREASPPKPAPATVSATVLSWGPQRNAGLLTRWQWLS